MKMKNKRKENKQNLSNIFVSFRFYFRLVCCANILNETKRNDHFIFSLLPTMDKTDKEQISFIYLFIFFFLFAFHFHFRLLLWIESDRKRSLRCMMQCDRTAKNKNRTETKRINKKMAKSHNIHPICIHFHL